MNTTLCRTSTADLLRPSAADSRFGTRCRIHPECAVAWPSVGAALMAVLAPTEQWCVECERAAHAVGVSIVANGAH